MSETAILDASAILAFLQQERGHEVVQSALQQSPAWVTTVNACETLSTLCDKGMPLEVAEIAMGNLRLSVVDFTIELGRIAASLRVPTKGIGASLGDRACLALAQWAISRQDTPVVYTAERAWGKLKWPFKLVLIR